MSIVAGGMNSLEWFMRFGDVPGRFNPNEKQLEELRERFAQRRKIDAASVGDVGVFLISRVGIFALGAYTSRSERDRFIGDPAT
jgi:hypothetical protein